MNVEQAAAVFMSETDQPTWRLYAAGGVLYAEVERLRRIETAAREVIAGEMPHECWHPELREALGEAP